MKRRYDLLYALGALLSSPLLLVGLLRSGKWRTDWKGRFGRTAPLAGSSRPTVLLHGVSVGEINATRDLVGLLSDSDTDPVRVVVSATTNTGIDRAEALYADRMPVVRFPFDFSWMVSRFLDRVQPDLVALVELEVWPNLVQACVERGIPIVVVNGRLSDSSFGTYRWARRWVRPMFGQLTAVAAQTEEYAQRFRELGVPGDRVTVTDTMKWDTVRIQDTVEGSETLRQALGIDPVRPLVVAGSTGPGEEERLIRNRPEGVQLLLVPRKPERFDDVARLAPGMVRRSLNPDGSRDSAGRGSDLFLLDTMGELTKAYALADVAFVGRSLVPLGGSDPIEPVSLGRPTLIGPRYENFRDVVSALVGGGGIRVTDRPMDAVLEILDDPPAARAMAEAGRDVIRARQGATGRHARLITELIKEEAGRDAGDGEGGVRTKSSRGKKIRRSLMALFLVYMAAGYLTTAFRQGSVVPASEPELSLPDAGRTLLSGVLSVHTGRSHDARGTREQVAAAAARAGLDFVVIGDHPADDRRPDWSLWTPEIMSGVLIEGGQELRAPETGKVLAIGVDSTFKRWEGGLGSFLAFLSDQNATSMVVHGRGPRGSERWEHRRIAGVNGWEVLDISESSRARLRGPWSLYHLLLSVVGYPFGLADEALLHTMREGFMTPTVMAYDSLRMRGPLTATAGLNVHPKLALGPVLAPSYGPFFRTLVTHVAVDGPRPEDPMAASGQLARGLTDGEVFISLGNHEEARAFRFRAVLEEGVGAPMGRDLPAQKGIRLRAGFQEDPGRNVVYRVLRNGRAVEWVLGPNLEWEVLRRGFHRIEVYTYSLKVGDTFFRLRPWIFTNPIGLL